LVEGNDGRYRLHPLLQSQRKQLGDDRHLQVKQIAQHVVRPGVDEVDQVGVAAVRLYQDVAQVQVGVDAGPVHVLRVVEQLGQRFKANSEK
jgi:hypothetical protein